MERRPVSSLLVIACAFATLAGCAAVPESSRETGYLAASRADVLAGDMVPQDPAPFEFWGFVRDLTQVLGQVSVSAAALAVISRNTR